MDVVIPSETPDAPWLEHLGHVAQLPAQGLDAAWEDVRGFHKVMGQTCPDMVQDQTPEEVDRRSNWIDSETQELRDATSITERADAYLDIIYFAIGGLVELGIRPQPLFDLVQRANMAKVQPDGTVKRTAEGKVIKPVGWVAPDEAIAHEIARQLESSTHASYYTCSNDNEIGAVS